MRIGLFNVFFLLLLICTGLSTGLQAQVITTGPDSVEVAPPPPSPKDTIPFYRVDLWSKPGKAALMSAIVPGLGQVYNKSYWKVPVIYAGAGVLFYFVSQHQKNYLHYRTGVRVRQDTTTTDVEDEFTERLAALNPQDRINQLKRGRDTYRRWRDQTILLTLVAYTINVAEAYVYAHLKDFDISDDLSMKVNPNFIYTASTNSFAPALTLSINFKNNAHSSHRIR